MRKYIIFGSGNDYNKVAFEDAISMKNVLYVEQLYEPKHLIDRLLYRFFQSRKFKFFSRFLSKSYFKKIMSRFSSLDSNNDICFIYMQKKLFLVDNNFIDYSKKYFPNSYHVALYLDSENFKKLSFQRFQNYQEMMDMQIIIDKTLAKKYNIHYYPPVFSFSNIALQMKNDLPKYDIIFVGKAKDRLELLLSVYKYLTNNNLKCGFYIAGVSKENQSMSEEINYINKIPYYTVLKLVQNANCILEVTNNTTHFTQRIGEAVYYKKKILTNNKNLKFEKFYNQTNISIFQNISDIDIEFLRDKREANYYNYGYLSSKKLIEYIDSNIDKFN